MINAAVLEKFKKKLKIIKNIRIPKLLSKQVLIKIKNTAICGSQIHEIRGHRNTKKFLPHVLGHEATGIVVDVGKNVHKFKKKDKVILSWIGNDIKESKKPTYFYPQKKKKINSGLISTFSNFTIVSQSKLIKLPKNLSFEQGTLLGCAFPTGSGIILNQTKIEKKTKILIYGLGGVGLSALVTLLFKRSKNIYIYDKNEKKIKKIISYFKNKHKLKIIFFKKKSNNDYDSFFDYVIECTGIVSSIEKSLKLIKNKGKVIFASHPAKDKKIKIFPHELIKGKKIEGSWGGNTNFLKNMKEFIKIFKRFDGVERLFFTQSYSLFDINKAITDMINGKTLRPIIKFNK
jgi:S-(hydroxymethyl)glutathione dehydrogenase / alcohol dehydrogenase